MGMLRLYLTSRFRLHIWCPSQATPDVSTYHTHPWDFSSLVVAGLVQNRTFSRVLPDSLGGRLHCCSKIKCGTGGGLCEDESTVQTYLRLDVVKIVKEGQTYSEKAEVIHESVPVEGTVTIVDRSFKEDTEHAYVFWPYGKKWVSAEPREATTEEVEKFCTVALGVWFN